MRSWNGAVKSVVLAAARSTCSAPSTSRRVRMPAAARSSSFIRLRSFIVVYGQRTANELCRRPEVPGRIDRNRKLGLADARATECGRDIRVAEQRRDQPVAAAG